MKIYVLTRSSSESTSVEGAYKNYDDAVKAKQKAEEEDDDTSMPSEYEIDTTTLK